MCGISGFIYSNATEEQKTVIIKRMLQVIRHRGPDDSGFFADEWAAIGMQRLSIIDLNTGHQPIFTDDKLYGIVFNGEIYNYKELRRKLKKKGYTFRTDSDTEVILALYRYKGARCLDELDGMFSFAIYDRWKREIFIARDPFGIKPLYYIKSPQYFAFASEVKSLLKFPLFEKELNIEALQNYLSFDHVPAPQSIFMNMHKVLPGQYILINEDGNIKHKYYSFSFRPKIKETSEFRVKMRLKKLLEDAVEKRLMSDVPLGAFLSGGIDSSLVAAIMQKYSRGKINTFSIGFDEKSFDESDYAQQVAQHISSRHYHKTFTAKDALKLLPEIVMKMDEPFADPSLLPTYLLSQFTGRKVKVALSGDASDELFAGYPTYYARKLADKYGRFLPYSIFNKLTQMLPTSFENISFDFKAKKFAQGLRFEPDLRHQVWLGSFDNYQKIKLLEAEYKLKHSPYVLPILRDHMHYCDTEDNWERSLWADMRFYLQDNMLVKVDRASMFNSLEVRVPFLDKQLVDYIMHLPAHLKYRGKESKYILKQVAADYLPQEIIHRPKKGFGIPVAKWLKDDLLDIMQDYLSYDRLKAQGIFNPNYVEKLIFNHLRGKKDNRKYLWSLLMFEMWYENYIGE